MSVLLGNGDDSFQPARTFTGGNGPLFLAVGDFNGDGIPDLAVTLLSGASVLLGNGDDSFRSPLSYMTGNVGVALAVADFDQDGTPDLAVVNGISNDVTILLNDGIWPDGQTGAGSALDRPLEAPAHPVGRQSVGTLPLTGFVLAPLSATGRLAVESMGSMLPAPSQEGRVPPTLPAPRSVDAGGQSRPVRAPTYLFAWKRSDRELDLFFADLVENRIGEE